MVKKALLAGGAVALLKDTTGHVQVALQRPGDVWLRLRLQAAPIGEDRSAVIALPEMTVAQIVLYHRFVG